MANRNLPLPIIALDFATAEEVENFLDLFDEPLYIKIGMELYYQTGPELILSLIHI